MKKLLSLCNDSYTLEKIKLDNKPVKDFLSKNGLDGIELLKTDEINLKTTSKEILIGRHLFFYPLWMDFYNRNDEELLKQFGDWKTVMEYYDARDNDEFVENLRNELIDAQKYDFKYVVMHASHMNLTETFTQKYKYNSLEITEAFIKNLNIAMEGLNLDFDILIENNWYPGFNFLEKGIIKYYIENVKSERIGFMLDTAHLVHTGRNIDKPEKATEYILKVLEDIKEYTNFIKGIHLNLSISNEYLENYDRNIEFDKDSNFYDRLNIAAKHILNFDRHEIYNDKSVQKIIKKINPKYLTYEFSFKDRKELEDKIRRQNQILG